MAYVQSNSGYPSTTVALNGIAAGACLVAFVSGHGDIDAATLPSPWVKQTPQEAAGGAAAGCFWVYANHPGGNLSSAISSPPGDCGWEVAEFSGRDPTSPVDQQTGATGASNDANSGNITPSVAGTDLVGAYSQNSDVFDATWSGSWVERRNETGHSSGMATQDNVGTSAVAATVTASASSFAWVAFIVALKPAAGGGGAAARSFAAVMG